MRTVILATTLLSGLCCGTGLRSLVSAADVAEVPAAEPAARSRAVTIEERTIRDDWPVFRGDPSLRGCRRGTISRSPKLVWTHDAETAIESTAAVVDGRVFIGTGEKGLLALDAREGKVVWSFPCEFGIRTSPGVREGRVYFGDDVGIFRAVDATSGKLAWKFDPDTGAEIASSASFYDDLVLFGSYDACLYALARRDGTLRWKVETEGPVHCTPAIGDGHTFVAGCDERLRTISIAAGKEVAALSMSAYSAASPAILNDRLFVGTFASQVICVRWREQKGVPTSPAPTSPAPTATAEGASAVAWAYEHPRRKFPYYSSPAVGPIDAPAKARRWAVVFGGRDKMVHAVDADSGESLWTFSTRAGVDGSPVIVGAHVLVGGLDGRIYCLELATGDEHWVYDAGTPFRSSPAIAAGNLYIASDEGLIYCFDLNPDEGKAQ